MSTSRERFRNALNHRQPDRIPVDFGGTGNSRMHVTCVAALRDYYGLDKQPVKIADLSAMTGEIEDDLKEALGIDVQALHSYGSGFCKRSGYIDG